MAFHDMQMCEKPSRKSESVLYAEIKLNIFSAIDEKYVFPIPTGPNCGEKKKLKFKLKRAATEFETSTVTEAQVDLEHISIWPSFTAVKTHRLTYKRCLKPSA